MHWRGAFRYAAFQVVSIVTTTGYATADYEMWPAMSQIIIFLCMFVGASAGSTGGGMKCLRIMVCLQILLSKSCFPDSSPVGHAHQNWWKTGFRGDRSKCPWLPGLVYGVVCFFHRALAGIGVDFITALGAVAATIGNIGPGFGMVGPVENFSQIPYWGKWLLSWCMLLGRLEIYTLIVLVVPEFWRK
jgi:trk system potassium uptake protein TrkH